ncbi:MAG: signal recognition particle protein [Actinobacteria bacterium HGW-Actinobacteria-7]|jgi:signal recognition particle subunit SRP54|nr:MAG: signal recognition particle protein [Actinobacteria bacterium HGW-Actinobacteria-7]
MFDNLSDRLQKIFAGLTGKGRLSEADVDVAMREIRMALLEADVNFKVVKEFVARVKERAVGSDVMNSLTPGQQVIKIVLDEMVHLLGDTNSKLALSGRIPNVLMLVGLQGSGKTTATAKLAYLMRKQGRRPLMVACDVHRPAAIDQLEALGREMDIPVYRGEGTDPVAIAKQGVRAAIDSLRDLVIVDTAGRLHVDEEMMDEAAAIRDVVKPDQILMVVDAMTGQDAVNVAAAFAEKVNFDGVIMSKMDGDARGGAALSIRQVTGKPIKFISAGEKPEAFEPFHPDRMAKRILGMGDVVSLIEKAQEAAADAPMDEKTAQRLGKGDFTLDDFLSQISQVRKMGGLGGVLKSLPGAGKLKDLESQVDEKELDRTEAIIRSMTLKERANPKVMNGTRRERVARGAGVHVSDVNRLLKQFAETRKMMKQLKTMQGKGKKHMRMPGGFPGF